MACGCKSGTYVVGAQGIPRSNPTKNSSGIIPLGTGITEDVDGALLNTTTQYCTAAYRGMFRGATVFIVGYGTAHEELFIRSQRDEAIAAARARHTTLDQTTAGSLCDTVMYELLEA